MSWKEVLLYTVFILVVIAISLFGVMRTETHGNRLDMTDQEISHVMKNLEKRSAADCVLERTEYGFKCSEMGSNKIYKVRVK
jgi:hypothetical protein